MTIYHVVSVSFHGDIESHGFFGKRAEAVSEASSVRRDPDIQRVEVIQGEI